MATKVKPSRVQATGTPQAGQVPVYVDEDKFEWGEAGSQLTEYNAGNEIEITQGQETEQSGTLIEIEGKLKNIIAYGETQQATETYLESVTANGKCELSGTASPTTPINIVSNNGTIKVSPNLLNMNDLYGNYLLTDGGQVGSEAQNFILTNFIRVFPNTTYVFSFISGTDAQYRRVCGYSSDDQTTFTQLLIKKARPTTVDTQIDLTFTTGASTNYIRISTCIGDTNVQVVEGSTAPTYRPYKQIYTDGTVETVTDNVGNVATCQMLLGIINSIDTQEILTGAVTRDIDITVLDGSEDFTKYSSRNVFSSSDICPYITRNKSTIYCTHFVYGTGSSSEIPDGTIATANTSTNVFIRNDSCTSVAEFQQWLKDQYTAGTPVIIVYQRQDETTETVAGQVLTEPPATVTAGSIASLTITTVEGTAPSPQHPLPIFCNNGELKVDNQGNVYADGTTETIRITGKNLFDKTAVIIDKSIDIDGAEVSNIGYSISDYISVIPGQTYIRSLNGVAYGNTYFTYDKNKTFIATYQPGSGLPFTIASGVSYIRFNIASANLGTYQLELGSTATTYEQYYNGGTATAENLFKIGTYQDVQSIIDGNITRNVGIKVLNGSENWTEVSGSSAPFALVVDDFKSMNLGSSVLVYSTHFQGVPANATWSNYDSMISFTGSQGSEAKTFRVRYLANTKTLAEFKQFLAEQYANGTPVICVYYKQTTTETVAGQPLDAEGNLTISATGEISPLTLKVIFDTFLKIGYIGNDVKVSATAPSNPTEGMVWYDTTNDILKTYDGSQWKAVDEDTRATWGNITGTLSNQTDLQNALNGKVNLGSNTLSSPDFISGTFSMGANFSSTSTLDVDKLKFEDLVDDDKTDLQLDLRRILRTEDYNGTVTTEEYGFTNQYGGNKIARMKDIPSTSDCVKYEDFETSTVVGATLTISYFTTQITPSANFTLVAGTVKEGMQYIVRVNTGATAYTMSLGTGVTNPFGEDLTLTASKTTTVVLLATSSSTLEVFSIRTAE